MEVKKYSSKEFKSLREGLVNYPNLAGPFHQNTPGIIKYFTLNPDRTMNKDKLITLISFPSPSAIIPDHFYNKSKILNDLEKLAKGKELDNVQGIGESIPMERLKN